MSAVHPAGAERDITAGRPVVQLAGITKLFPGLVANDAVDFDLRRGEIHALLGENGAGKSTLMNILTGIYQPDAGQILIDGAPTRFPTPSQAIAAGIGMVHQHFKLIRAFTVAENIHLGWHETPRLVTAAVLEQRTLEFARKFNLDVRPEARIQDLSAGEQQRVEILRVLTRGARVLILDEPTAVLTPREAAELFKALRIFTAGGYSVIFISHKLDEVLEISDRITVLRAGRRVATLPARECDHAKLATLMVGREIAMPQARTDGTASEAGKVVLQLVGVSALDDRGVQALTGIDLDLHAGEIVGVAGVAGNGQRELTEVLTGMRPVSAGKVRIRGKVMGGADPAAFLSAGIGHIPEDRLRTGLAPSMPVVDNAVLREYMRPPIARGPLFNPRAATSLAKEIVTDAEVLVPNMRMPVRNLSGGNQQRLVARREMRISGGALVAAYPTRGLDVGAINTMLHYLIEMRDAGVAVLLISEELEELLNIADRVVVLFKGRIMGGFDSVEADLDRIGLLMGGRLTEVEALVPAVGAEP
jgi:general nucleoside transport system ATP-binding protein